MKTVTKVSLICITLFLVVSTSYAQNRPGPGTIGISASLQSNQTNLTFPIWTNDHVAIAPIFGLTHREDSFTSLNIGVSSRFYQDLGYNFASYVGARGILQRTTQEVGAEDTDFLLGAAGGGEYFFDGHFSVGVEGQLNFLLNNNGNNTISTGAALTGTFYF